MTDTSPRRQPNTQRPLIQHVSAGRTLYIGDAIQIEIRGAHRGKVKVAVIAPRHLTVVRSEATTCEVEPIEADPDNWARIEEGAPAALPARAFIEIGEIARSLDERGDHAFATRLHRLIAGQIPGAPAHG